MSYYNRTRVVKKHSTFEEPHFVCVHLSASLLTRCTSNCLFLCDTAGRLGTQFWLLGTGGGVKAPGKALILQWTLGHWSWGCWGWHFNPVGVGCESSSTDGALLRTGYWLRHWPCSRNVSLLGAWENHSAWLYWGIRRLAMDIK